LGIPGWACGVSGAASRQLVVPHRWGIPGWAGGVSRAASRQLVVPHRWGIPGWACGHVSKWSCVSTAGGTPPLGHTRLGGWCKWSCLSTAGGTPLLGHTRLGVWCKWSCLSTAGGTPPLGYPAGWACGHARQPRQTPSRGGKPGIDDAFPLLSLGAHSDGAPSSCSPMPRPPPSTSRIARAPIT
jgi:hypothetical protein